MMIRVKILALALVAVVALGAMAASMASAQQGKLTTDGTSVTQDAVEDGKNLVVYPGGEGNYECPGSTAVGHELATTPHQLIPANATTATITPTFANCHISSHKVTVTLNGCDFVFHIGATTGVTDTYSLSVDVVCPEGAKIEVHEYLSSTESKTALCTIFVPAQTGIKGYTIANEIEGGKTNDTLTITGRSSNVKMSKSGLCGSGETSAGEQELNFTVTGTNASKEPTGMTITDA